MNKDNLSAHDSAMYDREVLVSIPYYRQFHEAVISLVKAAGFVPRLWLDTGCGTGALVEKILDAFPETNVLLADPSSGMLEAAKEKLADYNARVQFLTSVPTQELTLSNADAPDIITAVQCHHYMQKEERARAVQRCYSLLGQGGLFIAVENIRPVSKEGIAIGKRAWLQYQLEQGRSPEAAEKHMARFDTEYFPITVAEHLDLLQSRGFRTAEIFWYAYMQAGVYGIK